MYPYNRSIWKQIKTFSWWFFTLITLIPVFGVQQFYFLFVFACIDKDDEFQLYSYILDYKALQFVTQGVVSAFTAYARYFYCTTMVQDES